MSANGRIRFIQCQVITQLILDKFKESPVKMIEIGTQSGGTAIFILEHIRNLTITCIDPSPRRKDWCDNMERYVATPIGNRAKLIELPSDDACKALKQEYDIIWIDGDHAYEQVVRDIKNYLPLVKSGGILGGHDYDEVSWGVKRAVDEVLGCVQHGDDLTWWKDVL